MTFIHSDIDASIEIATAAHSRGAAAAASATAGTFASAAAAAVKVLVCWRTVSQGTPCHEIRALQADSDRHAHV